MPQRWVTLTEHILKEEQKNPEATGKLTLILNQIAEATKIIASHVKKSGLVDIQGKTGDKNVYQEDVQKLDKFSNDLMVDLLTEVGFVNMLGSEELPEPILLKNQGEYSVFFDPLDGSSNVDTNVSIGTIFSIYKNSDNKLQPGRNQVAAGYALYGSSVMFVYTVHDKVDGFTLDPAIGSYLLSHPNIKIPESGKLYSTSESRISIFSENTRKYLESLRNASYKSRWIGTMVADMHQVLLKGGVFLFPESQEFPKGKLRLVFEINPFSFIVERAGGKTISGKDNPLDLVPEKIDQIAPIVIGSKMEVEKYLKFTNNNGT